jgi:hypothetical protein
MDVQERVTKETWLGSNNQAEFVVIDADNTNYQMKPDQQVMHFTTALGDAAAIVILPSKAEAVGRMYYICATTGSTGGDISVYDKETGAEISTYGDLDADDDHVIFFCDGINWRVLLDGVA